MPLNETGVVQAEVTGMGVAAEWKPATVYSSPLSPAIKTAEAIAKHFDLPMQIHPGLAYIDYGGWQGLTPDKVRDRWPAEFQAWYHQHNEAIIPGGETLAQLRFRSMSAVNELSARHAEQTIVLVGHTVINRIILLGVLGLGNERFWHFKQDTCAINVFRAEKGDFVLVSLNDTCHLHD